ncbi:MAG: hypothetical protein ACP5Q5_10670 [Brevinematia bacterium]
MKNIVFIFRLILLFLPVILFSDFNYRILVSEEQNFVVREAVWNPENIFNIKSGLSADLKLLGETTFKFENFKLKFSDLATMPVETNGNFTNSLLEAYLSLNFYDFYLDAGKKRIVKGKGFLYSPSDFSLNQSFETTQNKDEVLQFKDGLWLTGVGYYSGIGNFSFYYIPDLAISNEAIERYFTKGQDEIYLLSYSHSLDFMDVGVVGAYSGSLKLGSYGSFRLNDNFVFYTDFAFLERVKNYELELKTYPYVGDIYQIKEIELSNRFQFIFGVSFTHNNFGLMIEYFYNGGGFEKSEFDKYQRDLKDTVKNFDKTNPVSIWNVGNSARIIESKGSLSLSQHYGMLRLYSLNLENFELASLVISSLTDFSGRFCNLVYYNIENITLGGEVFVAYGEPYREFMLYGEKWGIGLKAEVVF